MLGERGPRKMRVLIPELKPNGDYCEWRPTSVRNPKYKSKRTSLKNKDGMIANYNENNYDQMKVFANKEPQWNEGNEYHYFYKNQN